MRVDIHKEFQKKFLYFLSINNTVAHEKLDICLTVLS